MLQNELYVYGDMNLKVPAHLNYGQCMLERLKMFGNNVAIINSSTGESLRYCELAQLVVDIALSLARMGVGKGDVVGISSEEHLEYIPTILGIICAGASYAATECSGKASIIHRAGMAKPKVVFCSLKVYQEYRDALQSVGSVEHYIVYGKERCAGATLFDEFLCARASIERFIAAPVDGTRDHAIILYSSGTTGLSKCVPLTHLNMITESSTRVQNPCDPEYMFGKRVLTASMFYLFQLSCLYSGASVVFVPNNTGSVALEAVDKFKIVILQLLPSTLFEIVNSPSLEKYDLRSLERIVSCTAPLRAKLLNSTKERFPNVDVRQIYGSSECGAMCSDLYAPAHRPDSVGFVMPDIVAKVVDIETRQPLGPKQNGEICLKGCRLFPGYIGDSTFAHLDEEGFFKTGDMGYYDDDKYFYVVDRIKDVMKYSGFTVSPADLEAVLAKHPVVLEAAVAGLPDEQCYELPTAFVVLKPDADITAQELTNYVNSQVAEWMPLAGGVRFLSALPRATRGKIDRKALRQM